MSKRCLQLSEHIRVSAHVHSISLAGPLSACLCCFDVLPIFGILSQPDVALSLDLPL